MSPRTVGILQPSFLPWLGYFAQMFASDVFVLYDNVQFDKSSWRNRNRIKSTQGSQWLTVPVKTSNQGLPTLRELRIDNGRHWRKKHIASIEQNYSKARYYGEYVDLIRSWYEREWEFLLDLNEQTLADLTEVLGLQTEIRLASDLDIDGDRISRLVGICHAVGADCFYEGAAGRDYIDERPFKEAGVAVEFQDYQHPVYDQLHGEFISHLSIIDLLFNCGPQSAEILRQ